MSRRHNLRRIKRRQCYSAIELACLLKVNIGTVRRWCMQGLRPIDAHRPYLYLGEHVAEFLRHRAKPVEARSWRVALRRLSRWSSDA